MRERVVADLVAVADEHADDIRVACGLAADDEERRRDTLPAEQSRDPGRPVRVGPVVERERNPPSRGRLVRREPPSARREERTFSPEYKLLVRELVRLAARADGVSRDPREEDDRQHDD